MTASARKIVFAVAFISGSLCVFALLAEIILQIADWPADRICGWRCS